MYFNFQKNCTLGWYFKKVYVMFAFLLLNVYEEKLLKKMPFGLTALVLLMARLCLSGHSNPFAFSLTLLVISMT